MKQDEEKAKGFLGSAALIAGFLSYHFTEQDWLGYLALAKNMGVCEQGKPQTSFLMLSSGNSIVQIWAFCVF